MPNVSMFEDRAGRLRRLDAEAIMNNYNLNHGEARILAALNGIQYVLELILEKMEVTDVRD